MAQTIIQGEYYFRKHEMVAGFNFSDKGTFEFFYSYGSSDRNATGSFSIIGDTLKLKSDKEAGHDFTIEKQSHKGLGYKIKCHSPNPHLLRYMQCIAVVGNQNYTFEADNEGIVNINLAHCDQIYAKNTIFNDIPTLIKDENNINNIIEIRIQASVQQVSFKGIDFLILDDRTISCLPNYFMPIEDILFIKE